MDYSKASLTIKTQELYRKIYRARDKVKEEYDTLRNLSSSSVGNQQMEDLKNIIECYDALLETDPKNEEELKEIEWIFNKGNLRTEKEIEEHKRSLEQDNYRKKILPIEVFCIGARAGGVIEIFLLLIGALAPLVPEWIVTMNNNSNLENLDVLDFWIGIDIGCIFSYIAFGFIFGFLSLIVEHIADRKIEREYFKAGIKKKFNTSLFVSTAAYAASLAYIAHMFKKKK